MFGRVLAASVVAVCIGTLAPAAWADELCSNNNVDGTLNGPQQNATPCHFDTPVHITQIMTYHWNGGQGAQPGTITLRNVATNEEYGPFEVTSEPGQGGAQDVYWNAYTDITVPAGDYDVLDSDPSTWSWNNASEGYGIVTVSGEFVQGPGDNGDDGNMPEESGDPEQ